jgi:ornithine--oxo-acid transaminase
MANNNFWGRSITASGACDDPARYTAFGPFTPGFSLVEYNNLAAMEAELKAHPYTVAVYIEPIQGEGGILMPSDGYLTGLKALCKKYNTLMILDEVQTGFGRTGKMFAYEHDLKNDKPDIIVYSCRRPHHGPRQGWRAWFDVRRQSSGHGHRQESS